MEIPPGYRFKPSYEELISYYLTKKVAGEALPSNAIIERELYGSRSPWEIFNDNDPWITGSGINDNEATKKCIYVFTSLKFKTEEGSRKTRTAGCGTWDGQTGSKPIFGKNGEKIGKWVMLSFVSNKEDVENVNRPHWIMHEFSLAGPRVNSIKGTSNSNCVICKITKDDSKSLKVELPSEDKKKKMKTLGKRKTPHEEKMTVEDNGENNPKDNNLASWFDQEVCPLLEKFDQITQEKEEEYAFNDGDSLMNVDEILEILDGMDSNEKCQLPLTNQVPLEQEQQPYADPTYDGNFDASTGYSLAGPDQSAPWMNGPADVPPPLNVNRIETEYIPEEMQNNITCKSRKRASNVFQEDDEAQLQNKKIRQEDEEEDYDKDWFLL